jgi:hypothetical protein
MIKFGRNFRRKLFKTVRRGSSIVRKSGNIAKGIIGKVDKFTGGALTKALSSDPRTQAMLTGIDMVADK